MPNTETDEDKGFWLKSKGLWTTLGICVFIFGVGLGVTLWIGAPNEGFTSNIVGDSAGAVNGLFSALAFAGVIYAILLQKHELRLQRKELEMTRDELKGQKEEFQTQNETLKRQRFENTFFNMLQLHLQIVDGLTVTIVTDENNPNFDGTQFRPSHIRQETRIMGREVFQYCYNKLPISVSSVMNLDGMKEYINCVGIEGYESCFITSKFDHYFRQLYHIMKFVAKSELIKDKDRPEYAAIVRSTLSQYGLVWLFYNGLSCYGNEKFKPLIEDFSLLKNLRSELLADGKKAPKLEEYASKAYE